MVRPEFILCLGVDPASALLGEKIRLNEVRGKAFHVEGGPGDEGEPAEVIAGPPLAGDMVDLAYLAGLNRLR